MQKRNDNQQLPFNPVASQSTSRTARTNALKVVFQSNLSLLHRTQLFLQINVVTCGGIVR